MARASLAVLPSCRRHRQKIRSKRKLVASSGGTGSISPIQRAPTPSSSRTGRRTTTGPRRIHLRASTRWSKCSRTRRQSMGSGSSTRHGQRQRPTPCSSSAGGLTCAGPSFTIACPGRAPWKPSRTASTPCAACFCRGGSAPLMEAPRPQTSSQSIRSRAFLLRSGMRWSARRSSSGYMPGPRTRWPRRAEGSSRPNCSRPSCARRRSSSNLAARRQPSTRSRRRSLRPASALARTWPWQGSLRSRG
mmetsp:Transcript_18087/g.59193  ORF Transcript_18087/g.59193 Transcript_18087/m.59193 type:complete len:247 (-) Transcript_18087:600-1340(-)